MSEVHTGAGGWDAIVVGGGIGGLVAAAYLARGRRKVLVVEARDGFGGRAETGALAGGVLAPFVADTLYALDPHVVRDLKLHRHGLSFAQRTMPLVAIRLGGRHLVLEHEPFAASAAIREESAADAKAYLRYRRDLFALARRLRGLWAPDEIGLEQTGGGTIGSVAAALELSCGDTAHLELASCSSAAAYLDRWFESAALKTALGLDTAIDGLVPQEAGSALVLVWRAAQENCGLQNAVGQLSGGPGRLSNALAATAQEMGAELRSDARAIAITVAQGRVAGIVLENGEELQAPVVVSDLGARRTLAELLPPSAIPFGVARRLQELRPLASAKLLFVLNGPPPFAGLDKNALGGRLVIAQRPESAAEAKGSALAGLLPDELVIEATVPTAADSGLASEGHHVLSIRVPYLPRFPEGGWAANEELLMKRVLATLEVHAPGLSNRVVSTLVMTPSELQSRYGADDAAEVPGRLLTTYGSRIRTPVPGLYLCGAAAEPADAISGRGGRLAAALVLARHGSAEGGGS